MTRGVGVNACHGGLFGFGGQPCPTCGEAVDETETAAAEFV
jgi:hypothetical protein